MFELLVVCCVLEPEGEGDLKPHSLGETEGRAGGALHSHLWEWGTNKDVHHGAPGEFYEAAFCKNRWNRDEEKHDCVLPDSVYAETPNPE